jgi:hypothetical protein
LDAPIHSICKSCSYLSFGKPSARPRLSRVCKPLTAETGKTRRNVHIDSNQTPADQPRIDARRGGESLSLTYTPPADGDEPAPGFCLFSCFRSTVHAQRQTAHGYSLLSIRRNGISAANFAGVSTRSLRASKPGEGGPGWKRMQGSARISSVHSIGFYC